MRCGATAPNGYSRCARDEGHEGDHEANEAPGRHAKWPPDARRPEAPLKLSKAQREALEVLVKVAEPPGGGKAEASKRRSTLEPRPNVNMIAAQSLASKGLARRYDRAFERAGMGIPTHDVGIICQDEFAVTSAGVAVWAGYA